MKEINELTRQLLDEGFTPEDTPPGTHPYQDYYGGWTYTGEAIRRIVWETPCGLLVHGRHFTNGHMSYRGVDWMPENNNPVVPCPKFPSEPCPLRNPLLNIQQSSLNSDDVVYQCDCHATDRPYTFEGSVDEVHKQVWDEADRLWEQFKESHKGRVCRHQSRYGRTTKTWSTGYCPMECAYWVPGCRYCSVLAKELERRKGNVFYDLRRTWTEKGFGLFPDRQKVSVVKGCKLLDKTVSLTICEAIVKYGKQTVENRIRLKFHHDLFFDKSLEITVENLRFARVDTRDIVQDLQDVANGIEVTHAADSLKAAKEQKKARRDAAKADRIKKMERMILAKGWDNLDTTWKMRAQRNLGRDRIVELMEAHRATTAMPRVAQETQISLF